MNNALPDSCDGGEPSKNCTFAVWDDNPDFPPGWCQLAEDGICNKENTRRWGEQVKIYEKAGKTMISRQRFEHISKGSPFLSFFIYKIPHRAEDGCYCKKKFISKLSKLIKFSIRQAIFITVCAPI